MPITTTGIVYQLLGSLTTFRSYPGQTVNDCKVVINRLLRAFDEPLRKARLPYESVAWQDGPRQETVEDHVVPVKVIMDWLLAQSQTIQNVAVTANNVSSIEQMLRNNLVITKLTPDEDKSLRDLRLHDRMPTEDWVPSQTLITPPFARYEAAEIQIRS